MKGVNLMTEEIEIEYKAMLTKKQFEFLLDRYAFPPTPQKQVNYYFETDQLSLKACHAALRIREKNNRYTVTLKQQKADHVLETHADIDQTTLLKWQKNDIVLPNQFKSIFKQLTIDQSDLKYKGYLTTERYSFEENKVIYCLDQSHYFDQVDYELEVEENTPRQANEVFHHIINDLQLTSIQSKTKIERFFHALHKK